MKPMRNMFTQPHPAVNDFMRQPGRVRIGYARLAVFLPHKHNNLFVLPQPGTYFLWPIDRGERPMRITVGTVTIAK